MRLAIIRQRYTPFGGAERFIERAIGALEKRGATVTLISRAWEDAAARRAIVVDPPYIGRYWRDASFSRAVRKLLDREPFDLVQSHERIPGCDVYRAGDGVHRQWLDYRLKSAPWIERVGIHLNPYHWYVCAAEREMFEHPALRAVICNSRMVAEEIRARFAIAPEKLHVIYNGVDLEFFNPAIRAHLRAAARAKLGLSESDAVYCFVGSGFSRKGLATAIDAVAMTANVTIKLIVAGHDRDAKAFVKQAARAGLGDRVRFVGPQQDVRFVYAASDCFILPTRYDPFPNAVLEALAMGIPSIVSNQCGAAEIIQPGVNGWICEPDSRYALSRVLLEAAQSRSSDIGAFARQSVENFAIERMADRMVKLYTELISEPMEHKA